MNFAFLYRVNSGSGGSICSVEITTYVYGDKEELHKLSDLLHNFNGNWSYELKRPIRYFLEYRTISESLVDSLCGSINRPKIAATKIINRLNKFTKVIGECYDYDKHDALYVFADELSNEDETILSFLDDFEPESSE